ncbi:hypothetical protein FACS1894174_03260 [Bacteroidia bacterium]|nr:hypothetical protein FACS1894174_03260 [Bacteroidia bacterium]
MWKNLFYFTRREKSGLLFLIILITGIFAGKIFLNKPQNQFTENQEIIKNSQNAPVAESNISSQDNKQQYRGNKEEKRTYFNHSQKTTSYSKNNTQDSEKIEKLKAGDKVNLNTADTTLMMRIPGIGKTYATRILKYREILGGYYSVEQLKEVYGMYEELYDKIIPFFEIPNVPERLIPVNKASLEQLKSHPYINFYQAKAIVELRKKNGRISGPEVLSILDEFPPDEFEKIKYYLSFEY